jgi:hypothetical protein
MKRILSPILAITAVLALMAPVAAFAQQPTPPPKGKGGPPPAKQLQPQTVRPTTTGSTHTPPPVVHPQLKPVVHNTAQPTPPPKGTGQPQYRKTATTTTTPPPKTVTTGPAYHKPPPVKPGPTVVNNTTIKNTTVINAAPHTTHIKQVKTWAGPKGGGGGGPSFSAANKYGGHWIAASAVPSGWNRAQVNIWNGHHYRWFNGGWLIVDNGWWPSGYYQLNGSSKMWNAQAELANMGYYDGPVDGIPGPDTRQAIANYQNDYQLPVTGHLNIPTQVSLGLIPPPPAD